MPLYVVHRIPGEAFDPAKPLDGQLLWREHAAFMNRLTEAGLVRLGGPLEDGTIQLVCEAASPGEVASRLAEDPWTPADILRTGSIRSWQLRLGSLA